MSTEAPNFRTDERRTLASAFRAEHTPADGEIDEYQRLRSEAIKRGETVWFVDVGDDSVSYQLFEGGRMVGFVDEEAEDECYVYVDDGQRDDGPRPVNVDPLILMDAVDSLLVHPRSTN